MVDSLLFVFVHLFGVVCLFIDAVFYILMSYIVIRALFFVMEGTIKGQVTYF